MLHKVTYKNCSFYTDMSQHGKSYFQEIVCPMLQLHICILKIKLSIIINDL